MTRHALNRAFPIEREVEAVVCPKLKLDVEGPGSVEGLWWRVMRLLISAGP